MRRPNRAIQNGNAIPAFQIGRVRQNQIGIGHGFAEKCIGIDNGGDDVCAAFILGREAFNRLKRIHRAVPGHIRHEHEQHINLIRVALRRIADHGMHHAMQTKRRFPGKGMINANGRSIIIDQQIIRPMGEGQDISSQRRIRRGILARGAGARRNGPREGRLIAPGTWRIYRTQQHLQNMQSTAGMKAVGMSADAAHGMHRNRPAHHFLMPTTQRISPGLIECDGLIEGDIGHLGRDATNAFRIQTAAFRDRFRRIFGAKVAFRHQMENGARRAAIR